MLVEAHDEWQVSDRRYLSEGSMALLTATVKEVAPAELMRRLNIHTTAWRPDHREKESRHNELGTVLWNLGDLADAPRPPQAALEIGQATLGPDDPAVAIRRNLDGIVQEAGGK